MTFPLQAIHIVYCQLDAIFHNDVVSTVLLRLQVSFLYFSFGSLLVLVGQNNLVLFPLLLLPDRSFLVSNFCVCTPC